jgi:hypothetical protein
VPGGTVESEGATWQQAMPSMLSAESSQPCIIPRQHAACAPGADGAKQASAGIAVQRTTTTSNSAALFLPMRIVYPTLQNELAGDRPQ